MFASLKDVVPKNGKGGLTPVGSFFPFNQQPHGVTLEQIIAARPQFASKILAALVALAMCDNSPTPFRLCACGCGAFVRGKAICAAPACRKRLERQRRALAGVGGKQFNLVWQHDLNFPRKN